MHPTLFDLADPGVQIAIRKFEQECQILGAINHPNIVQYLGTSIDRDNGLPVLLMELLDESLTHYLERSPEALPLHIQVNFSHNISQALAYLHSNGIHHRDLSSNNILLLGENKAKVTDFGMSQLKTVNSMTPVTMCPGNSVYMPPEALKENPKYTEKLDIFSFGVLLIQILTRQFPNPTSRFTSLHIQDPRDKKRMIEVQASVREVERREKHICLVDGGLLLDFALACLSDEYKDRPSANSLCSQLEEMKLLETYDHSLELSNYRTKYHRIKDEFDQQKEALQKADADYDEAKAELAQLQEAHEEEIKMLQQLLGDKDYVIQEKDRLIKAQEAKLTVPDNIRLRWRRGGRAPIQFHGRGCTAVIGNMAYFHVIAGVLYLKFGFDRNWRTIYQYDTEKDIWDSLPHSPATMGFTVHAIHNLFLTTIGGMYDRKLYTYMCKNEGEKWVERFPCMGSACIQPSATSTHDSLIVLGRREFFVYDRIVGHVLDLHNQEWTQFEPNDRMCITISHMPIMFVNDNTLYHGGGYDINGSFSYFQMCPVSKYKDTSEWKRLHFLPLDYQTITCFKGHILGIGGGRSYRDRYPAIKTIYRYIIESDTWINLGETEVARSEPMVAVVGNKIIVVGGEDSQDNSITEIATLV